MPAERFGTGLSTKEFPSPADEAWQRLQNIRAAQFALLKLRQSETLAQLCETLEQRRTDLPQQRIELLRDWQREVYRRASGFEVEERHLMQPLLEDVSRTGDRTIEALRQEVGRFLRNAEGLSD